MITLSPIEKANIFWRVQNLMPVCYKTDNSVIPVQIDITNDVLSAEWYSEIASDYGAVSRDSFNIVVSNVYNSTLSYNPGQKYSSTAVLSDYINFRVDLWEPALPLWRGIFKWKIYKISSVDNNSSTSLSIMSQPEVDTELTTSTIFTWLQPYQLAQDIITNYLWKTFTLLSVWVNDEVNSTIQYMSWYKDKAFTELWQLAEVAESIIFYDALTDWYIYATKAYIQSKAVWVTYDLLIWGNSYVGEGEERWHLLESNTDLRTDNILNYVAVENNSYSIKNNFVVYTFSEKLLPWQTSTHKQKLSTWEFTTLYTSTLLSATTWEDWSWDDYALINPAIIWSTIATWPAWVEWTFTNNHTATLWVTIQVSWTTRVPKQVDIIKLDQPSIDLYWRYTKKYSNKYFQNIVWADAFATSQLSTYSSARLEASITISWLPSLQLLDKVRVVNGFWLATDIYWLIKRIQTTWSVQGGYKTTLTLFYTQIL